MAISGVGAERGCIRCTRRLRALQAGKFTAHSRASHSTRRRARSLRARSCRRASFTRRLIINSTRLARCVRRLAGGHRCSGVSCCLRGEYCSGTPADEAPPRHPSDFESLSTCITCCDVVFGPAGAAARELLIHLEGPGSGSALRFETQIRPHLTAGTRLQPLQFPLDEVQPEHAQFELI
jgi:hypothetical protein